MSTKNKTKNQLANSHKFPKEEFLKSQLYKRHRDILSIVLLDDKSYTKADVDKLLNKFLTEVI
ncbi:MAG: hypothetical protein R3Y29_02915 [bacterium]